MFGSCHENFVSIYFREPTLSLHHEWGSSISRHGNIRSQRKNVLRAGLGGQSGMYVTYLLAVRNAAPRE